MQAFLLESLEHLRLEVLLSSSGRIWFVWIGIPVYSLSPGHPICLPSGQPSLLTLFLSTSGNLEL